MLEFYSALQNLIFNPDRIPDAVLAIILSIILGLLINGPVVPVLWRGWDMVLGGIGNKLNKSSRPRADLLFRGFIFFMIGAALAYFIGQLVLDILRYFPQFDMLQSFLLLGFLSTAGLWHTVFNVYRSIQSKKPVQGVYYNLSQISRLDLSKADDHGIARQALGVLVKVFDKNVVATIFWYLVGGIGFAFVYNFILFVGWRYGRLGHDGGFATIAMLIEKILGFIPSAITAFIIMIATVLTPGAGIARSFSSIFSFANKAPYEQGGLPLSIMSRAFDISLGGAVKDLDGKAIKAEWVGRESASAKVNPDILRGGLYIMAASHIIFICMLLGAYLAASL